MALSTTFRRTLIRYAGWVKPLLDTFPWLARMVDRAVINDYCYSVAARPHPLSTGWDYPNWDGLTDKRFSGRHLPPASDDYLDYLKEHAPIEQVLLLFKRTPGSPRISEQSTDLFANFAQWFTDGFLRTSRTDCRMNTSNHEIDLSPLYGRTRAVTDALREGDRVGVNEWRGGRGRLKSQMIDGAEYPPFFFVQDGYEAIIDDYLSANPGLIPDYENEQLQLTEEQKRDQQKKWTDLLTQLVQPDFHPILHEIGLVITERIYLADKSQRARIKNRFAAGVERANNQFGYVAFNTLFLREHNRLAALLSNAHQGDDTWTDERIFQTARNTLVVMLIRVVIEEYIRHISQLPFSIKADASPFYGERWYRPNWMTVEFNLLYRWHSLVPDTVRFSDRSYTVEEIIFNNAIVLSQGIAGVFDTFSRTKACDIGLCNTAPFLVEYAERSSVRIGRETRLMPYNAYRKYVGLPPARTFGDINSDPEIQRQLKELYGTPDRVEFYVGLFAEEKSADAVLPELITKLVAIDAFSQALTNPLLSEHVYKPSTFAEGWDEIQKTTCLRDILLRNIPEFLGNRDNLRVSMSSKGL